MTEVARSAQVNWQGGLTAGSGQVARDSSPDVQQISWPARVAETSEITSPEELIAAAHAGCFSMALSSVMESNDCVPDALDVRATCSFDPEALRITAVRLQVRAAAELDAERFAALVREAEAICPVSNALRGNVDITVDARLG